MFRDIQGRQADAATSIMNQYGLVFLQSAHRNQQRPGGQVIRRNCRALFEAECFGLGKNLSDRRDNQLSLSTKARHRNHRLADKTFIDLIAA